MRGISTTEMVVQRLPSRLCCGLGRLPSQISVIACRQGDWLQVRASHVFQKRSKSVYFHYNNVGNLLIDINRKWFVSVSRTSSRRRFFS
jgi:hypothetical protein